MSESNRNNLQVLLADPDEAQASAMRDLWNLEVREGQRTFPVSLCTLTSPEDVLSTLKNERFQMVFLAADFLTIGDLDVVSFAHEHQPEGTEVVVLYRQPDDVRRASAAIANGADGVVPKPVLVDDLQQRVRQNAARISEQRSHRVFEDHVNEELLGSTPQMKHVRELVSKVAPTSSTVLLTGETGVGKEFVANIIHRHSPRAGKPFVAVNCGAIPAELIESELFGHRKGSFTGAIADHAGFFEQANGGTIFLDEVGELPLSQQTKLLRVLQNFEVQRIGSEKAIKVNVRVISATNRDLVAAMRGPNATFREDLYYRLNGFQIALPPLRERRDVLPSLIKFYTLRASRENDKEIADIEESALRALSVYDYPGNIRELQNILNHAVVMSEGGIIRFSDLPDVVQRARRFIPLPSASRLAPAAPALPGTPPPVRVIEASRADSASEPAPDAVSGEGAPEAGEPVVERVDLSEPVSRPEPRAEAIVVEAEPPEPPILPLVEVEKRAIAEALRRLNGRQTEAARQLGISRSTLWRKMQEYGLSGEK